MNTKSHLYKKTSVISKVIYILLKSSSWPFAGLASLYHCLPCPEEPAQEADMAQQGMTGRKHDLSQPANDPLPDVAQDTAALPCCQDSPWSTWCPPGASLQSYSSAELWWCLPLFLPGAGLAVCLC